MSNFTFLFVNLTGNPPPTARRPKRRFWVLLAVGAALIGVCVGRPELRPLVRTLFRALGRAAPE
jgi:hypothetical protein